VGLGLAISREIIERHGGRIWLDTPPDGGAAFRFTLVAAI
jgi:two-component system sensor histidine kinase KdpD